MRQLRLRRGHTCLYEGVPAHVTPSMEGLRLVFRIPAGLSLEEAQRWSLEYDLWCKMEFFGEAIGQAMTLPPAQSNKPGPRNLLELLPDEFTRTDAERARQSEGLDAKGTSHMLSQWKSRGYISIVSNLNYRKLKYRSDGIDLLLHVPGFAGIRIHAGNTVDDTAGCILVGTTRPLHPGRLYDSRLWLHRLMRRLAERPLGEGVWITIN